MCCCRSRPRFSTARARSKGLAKPYYAGTGKGLKPEIDNAVAVAAAAIAVAVITEPKPFCSVAEGFGTIEAWNKSSSKQARPRMLYTQHSSNLCSYLPREAGGHEGHEVAGAVAITGSEGDLPLERMGSAYRGRGNSAFVPHGRAGRQP